MRNEHHTLERSENIDGGTKPLCMHIRELAHTLSSGCHPGIFELLEVFHRDAVRDLCVDVLCSVAKGRVQSHSSSRRSSTQTMRRGKQKTHTIK